MTMSNTEILRDYKAAKDKKKQVGILADLNNVKPEVIIEILKELGVDPRALPRQKKKPTVTGTTEKAEEAKSEPKKEDATAPLPTVKPLYLHNAERMRELFTALSEAMLTNVSPPDAWVEEFDALWLHYIEARKG